MFGDRRADAQNGQPARANHLAAVDEHGELAATAVDHLGLDPKLGTDAGRRTGGLNRGHSGGAGTDHDRAHRSTAMTGAMMAIAKAPLSSTHAPVREATAARRAGLARSPDEAQEVPRVHPERAADGTVPSRGVRPEDGGSDRGSGEDRDARTTDAQRGNPE